MRRPVVWFFSGMVVSSWLAWLFGAEAALLATIVAGLYVLIRDGLDSFNGVEVGMIEELRRQREESGR